MPERVDDASLAEIVRAALVNYELLPEDFSAEPLVALRDEADQAESGQGFPPSVVLFLLDVIEALRNTPF